jgi:kynurenine formamidase
LESIGFKAMDDELYINTQSGSQWDSLKHFAHQATAKYYNGLTHEEATKTDTNGIHNWCERGGIVGRGVLVDWLRWYETHKGGAPSPVSRHEITVEELEETLKWQGTITKPGDILIIRSGYVRWHDDASAQVRKAGTQENSVAIGMQASEKSVRWLYDHHFAAVAGDTVAFEAWPPKFDEGWCLHEWLLVQWGTPIGEMWDLEKLSRVCAEKRRNTFFLTSAPLHVKGGIGSPPGAIAIF